MTTYKISVWKFSSLLLSLASFLFSFFLSVFILVIFFPYCSCSPYLLLSLSFFFFNLILICFYSFLPSSDLLFFYSFSFLSFNSFCIYSTFSIFSPFFLLPSVSCISSFHFYLILVCCYVVGHFMSLLRVKHGIGICKHHRFLYQYR